MAFSLISQSSWGSQLGSQIMLGHCRPAIIASCEQHEAYIQRLLELQRKAHRSAEETETAKLLVVLTADYKAKQFTIEKASG